MINAIFTEFERAGIGEIFFCAGLRAQHHKQCCWMKQMRCESSRQCEVVATTDKINCCVFVFVFEWSSVKMMKPITSKLNVRMIFLKFNAKNTVMIIHKIFDDASTVNAIAIVD